MEEKEGNSRPNKWRYESLFDFVLLLEFNERIDQIPIATSIQLRCGKNQKPVSTRSLLATWRRRDPGETGGSLHPAPGNTPGLQIHVLFLFKE